MAMVAEQAGTFELAEVEIDEPRDDEVLVRIVATGLCHTDLTMRHFLPPEMFPHVFGHEGSGVVEAVGSQVEGVAVGDHVVLSFRSCRECAACKAGDVGYCEQTLLLNYMGMRADGSTTMTATDGSPVFGSFFGQSSLARHAIAHVDNCVVVDPALDLRIAAPYGCGFQTGAVAAAVVARSGSSPAARGRRTPSTPRRCRSRSSRPSRPSPRAAPWWRSGSAPSGRGRAGRAGRQAGAGVVSRRFAVSVTAS